jgi:hypothetical protein
VLSPLLGFVEGEMCHGKALWTVVVLRIDGLEFLELELCDDDALGFKLIFCGASGKPIGVLHSSVPQQLLTSGGEWF